MVVLQYAGNVLVYGPISPCDGDWFGSVNDSNAEDFLDAVLNMEVCTAPLSPYPACHCSLISILNSVQCDADGPSQSTYVCVCCMLA